MEGKTQQAAAAVSRHEREIGKEVAAGSAAGGDEEGQAKIEKQTGPVRGRLGE